MTPEYWRHFEGATMAFQSPIYNSLGRKPQPDDDEESEDDTEDSDPEVTAYYEAVERHYENYLDRKVKTYD